MRLFAQLLFFLSIATGLLGNGCSTTTPDRDPQAVKVARKEAERRGWRRVEVGSYTFEDGLWLVHVYRRPLTVAGSDAWVKVTPDGKVIQFLINPLF